DVVVSHHHLTLPLLSTLDDLTRFLRVIDVTYIELSKYRGHAARNESGIVSDQNFTQITVKTHGSILVQSKHVIKFNAAEA
ncbi:hypothetical protein, partial [Vibrio sp. 1288]|uniref:hypothetical protein n=1 Tax=Vibrio sp. 1288 TaxID=3074550 RepID=UPI00296673D0